MKKSAITAVQKKLTIALLSFMVALLVIISLPLNLIGGAAAEVVTAESTSNNNNIMTSATTTSVEVTVNYYRKDGKYSNVDNDGGSWNVWIWEMPNGKGENYVNNETTGRLEFDGTAVYDEKEWKTLTVTVNNVNLDIANPIGILMRYSTASTPWNDNKKTSDMMISSQAIEDNKVEIYIVDGNNAVYYTAEEAMAKKITTACFSDFETITFTTSQGIPENSIFVVRNSKDDVVAKLPAVSDGSDDEDIDTVYVEDDFNEDGELIEAKSTATIAVKDFDMSETYTIGDEPVEFNKEENFATAIAVSKTGLYESEDFAKQYNYDGELGVEYTSTKSVFRVWTPTASNVELRLYASGELSDTAYEAVEMTKGEKGVWSATVEQNLKNKYYTYAVTNGGITKEVVDPYARSGGRNGARGMIVDLASTNPEGWANHSAPDYGTTANAFTQAVIYEAHLRDLTIHSSSGVSAANRGKFLGLTEKGTVNTNGSSTALDYIKNLGVTQVHFQPLFDFASVNEDFNQATYNGTANSTQRNWGYDPLNYNMPEGSYSSNPADGNTRVNEMKQMIKALHEAGIQVVMDVVYNHVSSAPSSNFEALVPGYYFRMNSSGGYSNGSGCGNETASDHAMFRKFMIDSVVYWTKEYKVDGFRFDLMSLHDVETMNQLYTALAAINPDVLVYGEGWSGLATTLPAIKQARMANCNALNKNIAVFNDIVRDGIKGHYDQSQITQRGFATGAKGAEAAVYVGAVGGTNVLLPSKYRTLGNDKSAFAAQPTQNVNYVSAHDNSTLWDKINASVRGDKATKMAMNRMAAASVLTSQGASFMLAGEEMMRSKPVSAADAAIYYSRRITYLEDPSYGYSDNSYKSPDSVNAINWDDIDNDDTAAMIEFYKGMIQVKKTFSQFHFGDRLTLKDNVFFVDEDYYDGVAMYLVREPETMNFMVVIVNTNEEAVNVDIPNANYSVIVNGDQVDVGGLETVNGKRVAVGAYSAMVLNAEIDGNALYNFDHATFEDYKVAGGDNNDDGNLGLALGLGIGIPVAVLIAGGAVFAVMYSKKKKGKGEKAENETEASDDNKPEDAQEQKQEETSDAAVETESTEPPAEE